MLTPLIVITVCVFFFGLTWHNRPSRDRHRPEGDRSDAKYPDSQPSNS